MSDDIGPGDFVELIRAQESPPGIDLSWYTGPLFELGAVYVVREVGMYPGGASPWINLVGMPTPEDLNLRRGGGWSLSAFRKVYRRKSDLKEKLLLGIDQLKVDESRSPEDVDRQAEKKRKRTARTYSNAPVWKSRRR